MENIKVMMITERLVKMVKAKGNSFMRIANGGIQMLSIPSKPVVVTNGDIHSIAVFMDLPNIQKSFKSHKLHNIDYGNFVNFVVRHFVERAHISKTVFRTEAEHNTVIDNGTIAISTEVCCFTSIPFNFHPDDALLVAKIYRLLNSLQNRHGFDVCTTRLNFKGYHLRPKARQQSHIDEEHSWECREKGIDVFLASRLVSRCSAINAPDGVIIVSGDQDYLPAIREVMCYNTSVRVMVAAFSESMSGIYRSKKCASYPWVWPPLLLDNHLGELKAMRYRPFQTHDACVQKSLIE
jgi:uncharacterized LabA/DUF88 family protein